MGTQGDIMRLEARLMSESHFRGLTHEQWTKHYAVKFRNRVEEVLKKTGRLPTKEEIERDLA
jgi:hypothetical protein